MKLAIGTGVAYQEFWKDPYEKPGDAAARLRWWKSKGVEGIVFYDHLPRFYETPIARFREMKAVLDDVGLATPVFNSLRKSLHMTELVERDMRRLDHCLEVCDVLRPEIFDVNVNVPIPDGMDPMTFAARPSYRGAFASADSVAMAADRLRSVARTLAGMGAALSVELHDDGIHDTAAGCIRLVDAIGESNVGVNPDIGNWYRVHYQHPDDWRAQIRALAPRTNYWEVKNYKRVLVPEAGRAYSWNVGLDEGDIDFKWAATVLWRAGFRGWVCSEGGNGDVIYSNLRYLAYMRWILGEWIPSATAG